MFTIHCPHPRPCPGLGCLHSPVSAPQMLKSLLIMAQDVRRWLSEAGKTVQCPRPAADSLAPRGRSVPGHPPEADRAGTMDTSASPSVHSLRTLSGPAPTRIASRPCLQAASDLSWDIRRTQLLLEVPLSPPGWSGCPSVVFTLCACSMLCSCVLTDPQRLHSSGTDASHPIWAPGEHREGAFHSALCSQGKFRE